MEVLKHLYERVETLLEFINGFELETSPLAHESASCWSILRETVVCTAQGARACPVNPSRNVLSTQDEIVMRVVERLCKREGPSLNLLTRCYKLPSDNPQAQFSFMFRLEVEKSLNRNTDYLLLTSWKHLLDRIGDQMMEFLLEHRSVFIPVTSGCFVQLSGIPVYKLDAFNRLFLISNTPGKKLRRASSRTRTDRRQGRQPRKRKIDKTGKARKTSCLKSVDDLNTCQILSDAGSVGDRLTGNTEALRSRSGVSRSGVSRSGVSRSDVIQESTGSGDELEATDESLGERRRKRIRLNESDAFDRKFIPCSSSESIKKRETVSLLSESGCVEMEVEGLDAHHTNVASLVGRDNNIVSKPTHSSDCSTVSLTRQVMCRGGCIVCSGGCIICRGGCIVQSCATYHTNSNALDSCTGNLLQHSTACDAVLSDSSIGFETAVDFNISDSQMHESQSPDCGRTGHGNQSPDCGRTAHGNQSPDCGRTDHGNQSPGCGRTAHGNQSPGCGRTDHGNQSPDCGRTDHGNQGPDCGRTDHGNQSYVTNDLEVATHLQCPISDRTICMSAVKCKARRFRRMRNKVKPDATSFPNMKVAFSPALILQVKNMYFCTNLSEKYPPKHVLSNTSEREVEKLLRQMVNTRVTSDSIAAANPTDLTTLTLTVRSKLHPLLTALVKNHHRCRYKYMLKFHVTPVSSNDCERSKVSHQCIPHCKVFLFIRACILNVVPSQLFGVVANRNLFLRVVQRLIGLGQHDRFSVGQLMRGMQPRGVWKNLLKCGNARLHFLAKFLRWLVDFYVVPLIKSYFYVTTIGRRSQMCYFRIDGWRQLFDAASSAFISRGQLRVVPKDWVERRLASGQCLGVVSMRFVPKDDGSLRPIMNLSQKQKSSTRFKMTSINWQLNDAKKLLTKIIKENPTLIGSAKSSLAETQSSLKIFSLQRSVTKDCRPLYCVRVDVKHCFDSIRHDVLLDILQAVERLSKPWYRLRQYSSVYVVGGKLRRKVCHVTAGHRHLPNFAFGHAKELVDEKKMTNCILMSDSQDVFIYASKEFQKLSTLVTGTVIKLKGKLFRLNVGIPQGSSVSAMLCNLYYGSFESKHLSFVGKDELLMRQVDDFLYFSPHLTNARKFLEVMTAGIHEYNCYVNREKSFVNFDYDDSSAAGRLQGNCVSWNGLLIDITTLEVRADYSRYIGSTVSSTISVDASQNPGRSLCNKLLYSLSRRFHSIYFDCVLNCWQVAVENLFYMFSLHAYKLHYCVSCLPQPSIHKNYKFFVRVIVSCANCVWQKLTLQGYPVGEICRRCVEWTCYTAFMQKLVLHRSQYSQVLRQLNRKVIELESNMSTEILTFLKNITRTIPSQFRYGLH